MVPVPRKLGPHEYLVHVSTTSLRPRGKLFPIRLGQRLPIIPIPLKPEDPDARLDLQAVLDSAYDRAGYDLEIDYRVEPEPPLEAPLAAWADELLRIQGAALTTSLSGPATGELRNPASPRASRPDCRRTDAISRCCSLFHPATRTRRHNRRRDGCVLNPFYFPRTFFSWLSHCSASSSRFLSRCGICFCRAFNPSYPCSKNGSASEYLF